MADNKQEKLCRRCGEVKAYADYYMKKGTAKPISFCKYCKNQSRKNFKQNGRIGARRIPFVDKLTDAQKNIINERYGKIPMKRLAEELGIKYTTFMYQNNKGVFRYYQEQKKKKSKKIEKNLMRSLTRTRR